MLPETSASERLTTSTMKVMDASVSAVAILLITRGFLTIMSFTASRCTSFHIPTSRPLTVGIQSQPTVAWNVGLSAPRMPPLKSGLSEFFSFTAP